jgi:hypothetical protein
MQKNPKEDTIQSSDAWQVIREIKYTDQLQNMVDYHNTHHFVNFRLTLVMEPDREED